MKSNVSNALIYIPLGVLVILSFIVLTFGNTFTFYSETNTFESIISVNGTIQEVSTFYSLNFGISIQEGILSIIIGLSAVVALIGIQFVGSGLSDESVRILTIIIVFVGLWMFLSSFTYELFTLVEYFWLVYWFFTFLYVFGVIEKIAGGNA